MLKWNVKLCRCFWRSKKKNQYQLVSIYIRSIHSGFFLSIEYLSKMNRPKLDQKIKDISSLADITHIFGHLRPDQMY